MSINNRMDKVWNSVYFTQWNTRWWYKRMNYQCTWHEWISQTKGRAKEARYKRDILHNHHLYEGLELSKLSYDLAVRIMITTRGDACGLTGKKAWQPFERAGNILYFDLSGGYQVVIDIYMIYTPYDMWHMTYRHICIYGYGSSYTIHKRLVHSTTHYTSIQIF